MRTTVLALVGATALLAQQCLAAQSVHTFDDTHLRQRRATTSQAAVPMETDAEFADDDTAITSASIDIQLFLPKKDYTPTRTGTVSCTPVCNPTDEEMAAGSGCPASTSKPIQDPLETDGNFMTLAEWQAAMKAVNLTYIEDCPAAKTTFKGDYEGYFAALIFGWVFFGLLFVFELYKQCTASSVASAASFSLLV